MPASSCECRTFAFADGMHVHRMQTRGETFDLHTHEHPVRLYHEELALPTVLPSLSFSSAVACCPRAAIEQPTIKLNPTIRNNFLTVMKLFSSR